MTRDEYIAKGMLLGLVYLEASHCFTIKTGAGDRIDPDTLEVISNKVLAIKMRMDDVAAGKIGPPDGLYRGYNWDEQQKWQEYIAKGHISDAYGPIEHEQRQPKAETSPVDVLSPRDHDR